MAKIAFLNERAERVDLEVTADTTEEEVFVRWDDGFERVMTEREGMMLHALLGAALFGEDSSFMRTHGCP